MISDIGLFWSITQAQSSSISAAHSVFVCIWPTVITVRSPSDDVARKSLRTIAALREWDRMADRQNVSYWEHFM